MSLPFLSVIMPTRNRKILLRKAIEYFERRVPYVDAELIVVDTGDLPLDTSEVRGHRYIRSDSPVIGDALNVGVAEAKGKIIMRQDDDDWYSPAWYEASLRACLEAESGIVSLGKFYAYDLLRQQAYRWASWRKQPEGVHWSGGVMTFRREIWERSPFSGTASHGDDSEFLLRALVINPAPIEIVPNGTNMHVMLRHGTNITGRWIPQTVEAMPAVRWIMGEDMEWYEDLGDLLGGDTYYRLRAPKIRGFRPIGYFAVAA